MLLLFPACGKSAPILTEFLSYNSSWLLMRGCFMTFFKNEIRTPKIKDMDWRQVICVLSLSGGGWETSFRKPGQWFLLLYIKIACMKTIAELQNTLDISASRSGAHVEVWRHLMVFMHGVVWSLERGKSIIYGKNDTTVETTQNVKNVGKHSSNWRSATNTVCELKHYNSVVR